MIRLRPAEPADVDLVFAWANDPVARAVSFTTNEIAWPDHVAWYEASLANTNRLLLIAEDDGEPVALVRFDDDVISINVGAAHRGRGVGCAALQAACGPARERGIATIVAWIRPDNLASLRTFARAGYTADGVGEVRGVRALRYVLTP